MKKILLLLLVICGSVYGQVLTPANTQYIGTKCTKVAVSSSDWGSISNDVYFLDLADRLVHYKDVNGDVLSVFTPTDHPKGFFTDTTTQSIVNTALSQTVTLTQTKLSDRISIVGVDKIMVTESGYYSANMLLKVSLTSGASKTFRFWLRKNGVDVANSGNEIDLVNANDTKTATMPFQMYLAANDYIQIMMSGTSTSLQLLSSAPFGSPVSPQSPSVIINIDKVSD